MIATRNYLFTKLTPVSYIRPFFFSSKQINGSKIMREIASFDPNLLTHLTNQDLIPVIHEWGTQIAQNAVLSELRYKLLKFMSLRLEVEKLKPSSQMLATARAVCLQVNSSDPQIKETKLSFFKYEENMAYLYQSCYKPLITELRQNPELEVSQIKELFDGVLLNCEILATLQHEEFTFLFTLLINNLDKIQTSSLMNLALQVSSLHSLKPVPIEQVLLFVNEYLQRVKDLKLAKQEVLDSLKLMLKITRSLKSKSKLQEISDKFSTILLDKIPQTPQNMMQILTLEHQYQSSIYKLNQELLSLKEILISLAKDDNTLTPFNLVVLMNKASALLDDNQVLDLVAKFIQNYRHSSDDLDQIDIISSLLTILNETGLHDRLKAKLLVAPLFQQYFINRKLRDLLEEFFIFKRLPLIFDGIQSDQIQIVLYEQKNKQGRKVIMRFIDQLLRACFYTGVINAKNTKSVEFKRVEELSREFLKLAHNKEDQIQFHSNLVYLLVAYHNYLSPIWSDFLGSLIAAYQLKNKDSHCKVYLIFKVIQHFLNIDMNLYLHKLYREAKKNMIAFQITSKSENKGRLAMIDEVRAAIEQKQVEFYQNYMVEAMVDFYIPSHNLAILVDHTWRGEGLTLDQRVLEEILRCNDIDLLVLYTKREKQLQRLKLILEN